MNNIYQKRKKKEITKVKNKQYLKKIEKRIRK